MRTLDPNQELMGELAPEIERLYERHLEHAKEWYPHELIPYDIGRNYQPEEEWDPAEYPLPDAVRSSILINLLTEDNLPYYYEVINRWSPAPDHAWSQWSRQWTSEEDRHSAVIREWVHVTRAIKPESLERARLPQMQLGQVPRPPTLPDLLIYTSLQELATRVAHANTGRLLDKERGGKDVMSNVAADEALHHVFYRDLATAAIKADPSAMVIAAFRQIRNFEMPGTGIVDFKKHAAAIAKAGIYDLAHFTDIVVGPTLRHWDIEHIEDLSPEAEVAREELVLHLEKLGGIASRARARREQQTQPPKA